LHLSGCKQQRGIFSNKDAGMKPPRTAPVVLFGLQRSVYTRIARLALVEKQVVYRLEEVEIFGPTGVPAAHLARHPLGRIPVLQQGDFLLYETGAITRYVDEAFSGQVLQPSQAAQRARMNQIISMLDAYGYRPMVWGVFVQRVRIPLQGGAANEAEISNALPMAASCLQAMEDLLGDQPFLAGDALSLADLHAYPMLRCFSLAPEGANLLRAHPRLHRWHESMRTRPSVMQTTSSYEDAVG
jgi:glutathione S-transferase